ncbi:MAG: tryptophan-rich sensory protein [Anaerolineae bacterium]
MRTGLLRRVLVSLITVITIVFNGLANALPLNGLTTGEISDRFSVYFVPAAYVFSIWGLIYLGLLAYTVYQALPAQAGDERLRDIAPWYALASLANVAWLWFWHYEYLTLTPVAMLVLLVSLIVIYLRIGIGRVRPTTAERWCLHVPFSLYLGWITVATVANITSVLDGIGWSGWGLSELTWGVIMLVVAFGIAATVALSRRDVAYTMVIVWAFAGIAVKQSDTLAISLPATALAVILGLLVFFRRRAWRRDTAPAGVGRT